MPGLQRRATRQHELIAESIPPALATGRAEHGPVLEEVAFVRSRSIIRSVSAPGPADPSCGGSR